MPTRVNALAVMAKAPLAGQVKTRLVPPLTYEQAAALSRGLLADLLDHVGRLRGPERYLFFTPNDTGAAMRALARGRFHLLEQRGADLGTRMRGVFEDLWERGHRRMILIGGDLPVFPLAFLRRGFAWLDAPADRVVLGPSRDGGYYLVGMNRLIGEIFTGMTWSHGQVLNDTLKKIDSSGIEARRLPLWFDVDIPADFDPLRQLARNCERSMKNTVRVLRENKFY